MLETGPETEQETEVGRTPQQLDATKAGALVHLRAVVHLRERRFVERLKAKLLLKAEQQVYVLDVRRPSFLLQGRCLMQVEVVYPKKTMVFWCLYFDRETDAVVELFLNREKPIQDVIEQRFVEPLVERLKSELPKAEDPGPLTVPRQVGVIDVRTPSFLQDGYLVQVEVVYPDKTKMFWCLFFDSEKAAVVEPFLNRAETSIPDVIERITKARGTECIRIDPETVRDYVIEFMNYELADSGEAGLLLNDLDSRTFGVLDWPTPLLESEKKEVKKCLTTHSMQIDADTDYSLSVEACMVERDALVSREFRIFTKDNTGDDDPGRKGQVKPGKRDAYDPGRKGQVKPGKRDALVLLKGLPENCRAKRGDSLGVPEIGPLEPPAPGVLRSRFVEN